MKRDMDHLLIVSRVAMGSPTTSGPDVRIEGESAGAPSEMPEDELPPDVVGDPSGAFARS